MSASACPSDDKSLLLGILATARSLKDRLRRSAAECVPRSASRVLQAKSAIPLDLPYPSDMVSNIEKFALPLPIKIRIVSRIEEWYRDMRTKMQDEYTKTLAQLAAHPTGTASISEYTTERDVRTFYESFFRENTSKLNADIQLRLRTATAIDGRVALHKRKLPFNNESLPLLETYFEYNAYPSAQDRALLARKTLMCPRQIEVWFQNHRTRAKKEGRQLRRPPQTSLPREPSPECLKGSIPYFAVQKVEDTASTLREASPAPITVNPATNRRCVVYLTTPHAFPAKYPPTPDHVSCLTGGKSWSFPLPAWPRRSSSKAPAPKAAITTDELVVQLQQKLSITGAEGTKRARSHTAGSTPLAAPNLALIRQLERSPYRSKHASNDIPPAVRMACSSAPTQLLELFAVFYILVVFQLVAVVHLIL
ncbi:hypothetical protein NMY22_g3357 [Coprinellus aureogranulatus]|nr:hypothetical protein NMY22_g3357 [Coprinellus aureogranulatus]